MAPRPKYYRDSSGGWRWKITARNNKRTHSATEAFASKAGAKRNFEMLIDLALDASSLVKTEAAPLYE